jgi:hypothetical protein
MPSGKTRTYISVVHGATRNPSTGQTNVSKVWFPADRLDEIPDQNGGPRSGREQMQ